MQQIQAFLTSNMFVTFLLIGSLFLVRFFILRWIRNTHSNWTADQRLKATSYTRTFFVAILLIGFLYIWGEKVQSTAASLFVIAMAIVTSVKELLTSVIGSITRMRGMSYDLGDRIHIKDFKGDVIDINLLTTTLLEVGPAVHSHQNIGKKITFPNSLLVQEKVINESFLENFYLHNIKIPLRREEDWQQAKEILLFIATNECASYIEQARRRVRELERKRSIQMPSVDPRVWINLSDHKTTYLCLRFPVPSHMIDHMEQAILSQFLSRFYSSAKSVETKLDECPKEEIG